MKTVNLWKTFLFSALTLAAFTACDNNETEEEGGIPSITVNGGETATVAGTYEECTTEAVEVVSSGSWTLTLSDPSASWCTPSAVSGSKGTTQLTFKLAATTADREITATLTTAGSVEGIPMTDEAKIIIKQNAGGSSAVETNVAEVRALVAAMNPTMTKVDASADILALGNLVGVVSGDPGDAPNMGNKYLTVIQDTDNAENSGLMINHDNVSSWKTGQLLQISLEGAQVQKYNGTLQLSLSDAKVTVLGEGVEITPVELASVADIEKYQSQLVKFPNVQTVTEYAEGTTYASKYNADFVTEGGESFTVYTNKTGNENFGTTVISNLSGPIMGIANCYQKNNEGDVTLQLVPRNAEDVAGLTNPRFVLKTSAATIAEVLEGGEGAYKVENATVVAATTRSFVMQDASGVILVYCDKNTVPEVGSVVTVEGLVSPYSNVLQFDEPTVTVTGTGSVSEPTPTVVDASNIQTIIDAHKVVFVQISGELYKDGSYYNMNFSFETSKKGSIESPLASLNLDNYLDQMVDIKGWFIYTTGEGVRFTVVATEVSANTTAPNVKFDKDALNFDGSGAEPQKVGYTTQNVTGSVEMVLEGTDADKFEISAKDDSSVTVAVKGDNTGDAVYEASLVAKVGGKVIASVALTQSFAGVQSYVPVSAAPADWSGSYVVGYPKDETVNIIDAKFKDSATTTFTNKTLQSPDFDGTNIAYGEYSTLEIAKIDGTEFYSVKFGSEYVGWETSTGNNCQFTTTAPTADTPSYQWKIELTDDKTVLMTCQQQDGTTDRIFCYNASSPRFAVYKATSNQMKVTFYQLQ